MRRDNRVIRIPDFILDFCTTLHPWRHITDATYKDARGYNRRIQPQDIYKKCAWFGIQIFNMLGKEPIETPFRQKMAAVLRDIADDLEQNDGQGYAFEELMYDLAEFIEEGNV